jgi:flagellar basal-body rod modification protein FlgD
LQTSFDSLSSSLVSNQALQASTLVGRSALASRNTLAVADGQTVTGAVDLPASTSAVNVAIRDVTGQTIRTLTLGAQSLGLAAFEWNGLDDAGESAPAGRYTFTASYQSATEMVAADTLLRAPIDSVLLGAGGFTVELRGIGEVPFTAVREIRNETATDARAAAGAATD